MSVRPRTSRRAARIVLAALGLVALAGACKDSPVESRVAPFTISGTVVNNTGAPLPENARALVLWEVSAADPDYAYVFGEGTIDRNTNRFTITLDGAPPAEALNAGVLGVGMVIVTTDQTIRAGRAPDALAAAMLGATPRHAVIFRRGALPTGVTIDWVDAFPQGFGVGRGVDRTDTFDDFEPVGASAMELIVDSLDNMDFVNWT